MKKRKLTKVGLLLFLYHIPNSFLGDLFECDERQFKPIIENTCKSYKPNIIRNLCSFLGITAGTLIESANDEDEGEIFISNINKWIDFGLYIYLRSTGVVIDYLDETNKKVIHDVSMPKIGDETKKDNIDYLILVANEQELINSSDLKLYNKQVYDYNQKDYVKLIQPYLSKYVTNKEFVDRARGKIYKKVVSSTTLETIKKAIEEYMNNEENKINKGEDE